MYICPVCKYDQLQRPPKEDLICPSCGTHFGLDDEYSTIEELRASWIEKGKPWFSTYTPPPVGWSMSKLVKATADTEKILRRLEAERG